MNKKISIGTAVFLIIITVALTLSVTMVIAMRQFNFTLKNVSERQEMFNYITDVDKAVRQHFVGNISEEKLRAALVKGYLNGVEDPYAAYLTPDEYKKEIKRLSGNWTGLGLDIKKIDNEIVITAVHKNSSADKAGMKKGDIITQLDGTHVTSKDYNEVYSTLVNAEKAMITVKRVTESIAFEISQSEYSLESVSSRLIGTTGYIRITDFYSNTPDQFKDAYTSLEANGAENYVFDLRYNNGGDIDAAGAVISYLIPRGIYAHRIEAGSVITDLVSEDTYEMTKPSVTLVNSSTFGEAELFTAVLQKFNKTTVVGTHTAGKGKIQKFYSISADGAAFKLSVASLSLDKESVLEGVGVTPSVVVGMTTDQENRFEFLNEEKDPQLAAAISTLKKGIATPSTTNTQIVTTLESTTTQTK